VCDSGTWCSRACPHVRHLPFRRFPPVSCRPGVVSPCSSCSSCASWAASKQLRQQAHPREQCALVAAHGWRLRHGCGTGDGSSEMECRRPTGVDGFRWHAQGGSQASSPRVHCMSLCAESHFPCLSLLLIIPLSDWHSTPLNPCLPARVTSDPVGSFRGRISAEFGRQISSRAVVWVGRLILARRAGVVTHDARTTTTAGEHTHMHSTSNTRGDKRGRNHRARGGATATTQDTVMMQEE